VVVFGGTGDAECAVFVNAASAAIASCRIQRIGRIEPNGD